MIKSSEAVLLDAKNSMTSLEVYGWSFGPTNAPWTLAMIHQFVPSKGNRARFRVDTMRGVSMRLGDAPFLRVGSSRTTLAELAATNLDLCVTFDLSNGYNNIQVIDETNY